MQCRKCLNTMSGTTLALGWVLQSEHGSFAHKAIGAFA
jgi:hypothetical protein